MTHDEKEQLIKLQELDSQYIDAVSEYQKWYNLKQYPSHIEAEQKRDALNTIIAEMNTRYVALIPQLERRRSSLNAPTEARSSASA